MSTRSILTWCSRSAGALLLALLCSMVIGLARAEFVVVVPESSPAMSLSRQQIEDLFLNRARQLPGGGVPVLMLPASGTVREAFLAQVLGRTDAQARAYWARMNFTGKGVVPRELNTPAELRQQVLQQPYALAVMDRADLVAGLRIIYP